jgi:hypothetical protein
MKDILRPIKNALLLKKNAWQTDPFDRPYYCLVSDDELVSGSFLEREQRQGNVEPTSQ